MENAIMCAEGGRRPWLSCRVIGSTVSQRYR